MARSDEIAAADLDDRDADRPAGLVGLGLALVELDQLGLTGRQLVDALVDGTQLGASGVELGGLVCGQLGAALGLGSGQDGLDGLGRGVTVVERLGDQGADLLQHGEPHRVVVM